MKVFNIHNGCAFLSEANQAYFWRQELQQWGGNEKVCGQSPLQVGTPACHLLTLFKMNLFMNKQLQTHPL